MHLIIQAGGKGTRLESLTFNRPKCLVPVNNKPMLFWALDAFKDAKTTTVICDYKKDVLAKYVKSFWDCNEINVISADGHGTISGIKKSLGRIVDDEPIVIIWCDLYFDPKFELPKFLLEERKIEENYVGLSATFPCRWSFKCCGTE